MKKFGRRDDSDFAGREGCVRKSQPRRHVGPMAIRLNHDRRGEARGLTLAECLVALTILSFAVLAVSYAATTGQQQADYADDAARAVRLARDLAEEILSKPYADPDGSPVFGPEAGETSRAQFDDADDYHNFAEPAGQLQDFTGSAYTKSHPLCTRSVTITPGGQPVPDLGVTLTGLTVTIRVHTPGRLTCEIHRFIPAP